MRMQRNDERSAELLSSLIKRLARETVAAQDVVDARYKAAIDCFLAHAAEHDLMDQPDLFVALIPPRPEFQSHRVRTALTVTTSRQNAVGLGLNVMARPAHSFAHLRYGSSDQHGQHLDLTVSVAPMT